MKSTGAETETTTNEGGKLAYLLDKYGLQMDTDELAKELKYSDGHSIREAIRKGGFPVKTYRLGRKIVADSEDVAEYLERQKRSAA